MESIHLSGHMRLQGHENDFQCGGAWSLKLGIGIGKNDNTCHYLKRMLDQCPDLPPSFGAHGLLYNLERFKFHSDDDYLV